MVGALDLDVYERGVTLNAVTKLKTERDRLAERVRELEAELDEL